MLTLDLGRQTFGDNINVNNVLSRAEVNELLNSWVKNDRLLLHMNQVGYLMRQWALEQEGLSEDEAWKWEMAGLLHDADWDQWPDQHCRLIIEELEKRAVDPEIIHAIASHGPLYFGVEPVSRMDKMLYALDELSGLVHAYSLMRPERYAGMELKGVKKRLKEKSFAANVSRDDIQDACERAFLQLDDLIQFIIKHQGNVN
ncbi:HD domain-containing protein [Solitalea canadensis]|uniref:Putative HD superfamily hydrolase n=1 Tax=Solitalea canadensis (strain ATCC 29591 / DSM 3403 / JCM 21819 / LMG 8368 / NBRC 15130 / NCIMB 12057 / USAM 9D) TaxID=929556 RepID=H8KTF6_SOLCM|nr:HD domain-containing protein [Solitalea canadensis]AFD06293.1 putative HD superfamily hydrolase [Solitalea canadensis DSM 3403]